ncbi:MAG: hypothetical protein R2745_16355 [Vicinamibacterales bacterium]
MRPGDIIWVGRCLAAALRRLAHDERGQDLVEYALLTAGIGLAGIATWPTIAQTIGTVYSALDTRTQALWAPCDPGGCP